jgi:hypothetical protein
LYALRHLDAGRNDVEVKRVIAALTAKVIESEVLLSAQGIGCALYGLQNISSSSQVRALLSALTPKVRSCREELRAQEISMSLYGLQSMTSEAPEVRSFPFCLLHSFTFSSNCIASHRT